MYDEILQKIPEIGEKFWAWRKTTLGIKNCRPKYFKIIKILKKKYFGPEKFSRQKCRQHEEAHVFKGKKCVSQIPSWFLKDYAKTISLFWLKKKKKKINY